MAESTKDILTWPSGRLDFSAGCVVMGILNVTPDSFSDGGDFFNTQTAVSAGIQMASDGAAIIDIGAESTRPGSQPVSASEQIKRAIPVIEQLSKKVNIPISIDCRNYEVAKAATDAGASIINDITACSDERMVALVAEKQLPVIIMHMQKQPENMQLAPHYKNVVDEVLEFLTTRAAVLQNSGIAKDKIIIDVGIGFGKTLEHNIELLKNLDLFVQTGYRVLLGASRKRFIGRLTGREVPKERIFGTAATTALAASAGVSIVRVHDVPQMLDVVEVANRCRR